MDRPESERATRARKRQRTEPSRRGLAVRTGVAAATDRALRPVLTLLPLSGHERAALMNVSKSYRKGLTTSRPPSPTDLCSAATRDGERCSRSWRFRLEPRAPAAETVVDCKDYCVTDQCWQTIYGLSRGAEVARSAGVVVTRLDQQKAIETHAKAHVRMYITLDGGGWLRLFWIRNDANLAAAFEHPGDTPERQYLRSQGWYDMSPTAMWGPKKQSNEADEFATLACHLQALLHATQSVAGQVDIHVDDLPILPTDHQRVFVQPVGFERWPVHSWTLSNYAYSSTAVCTVRWLWPRGLERA